MIKTVFLFFETGLPDPDKITSQSVKKRESQKILN
jgi:hypothetical protein